MPSKMFVERWGRLTKLICLPGIASTTEIGVHMESILHKLGGDMDEIATLCRLGAT